MREVAIFQGRFLEKGEIVCNGVRLTVSLEAWENEIKIKQLTIFILF